MYPNPIRQKIPTKMVITPKKKLIICLLYTTSQIWYTLHTQLEKLLGGASPPFLYGEPMNIEELSKQFAIQASFIRRLRSRVKPKTDQEFIQILNDIKEQSDATGSPINDVAQEYLVKRETQPRTGQVPQAQTEIAQDPNAPQPAPPPQSMEQMGDQFTQGDKQFGDVNNPQPRGVGRGGQNSLVNSMLGVPAPITQDYAESNPGMEPTAGGRNWGTDFGAQKGTPIKNPFKAELEVLSVQDGFGDGKLGNRDNMGFGNQIVVRRTDTGEILDMAHLDKGSVSAFQPGDKIKPGQEFARVGSSGNSTGPHVSIETFDQSGNIKDIADIQPIDEKTPVISQKADGSEVYRSERYQPIESNLEQLQEPQQGEQPLEQVSANDDIQRISNTVIESLPESQRDAAKTAVPSIARALSQEGILSPEVLSYAVATASHESGLVPKEEIMATRGVNPRNDYIAGLQEGYSGGKDYHGRGYIQLTHDYNYKKFGDRIGEDLVSNPNKLLTPETSAKVLAAYFKDNGVADAVQTGDLIKARQLIQGQGAINPQFIQNTRNIAEMAKGINQKTLQDKSTYEKLKQTGKDVFGNVREEIQKPLVQEKPLESIQPKTTQENIGLLSTLAQSSQEGMNKQMQTLQNQPTVAQAMETMQQQAVNPSARIASVLQKKQEEAKAQQQVSSAQGSSSPQSRIQTAVTQNKSVQQTASRPVSSSSSSRPSTSSVRSSPSRPTTVSQSTRPAQKIAQAVRSVAPRVQQATSRPVASRSTPSRSTPQQKIASAVKSAVSSVKKYFGWGGGGNDQPRYRRY